MVRSEAAHPTHPAIPVRNIGPGRSARNDFQNTCPRRFLQLARLGEAPLGGFFVRVRVRRALRRLLQLQTQLAELRFEPRVGVVEPAHLFAHWLEHPARGVGLREVEHRDLQ